jgi:hypothetical protein
VQSGDPLISITAPASDRIIVYLPDSRADVARVGNRVRLERVATRARAHGIVASVAHSMNEYLPRGAALRTTPEWGRAVVIQASLPQSTVSGEAFRVRFD